MSKSREDYIITAAKNGDLKGFEKLFCSKDLSDIYEYEKRDFHENIIKVAIKYSQPKIIDWLAKKYGGRSLLIWYSIRFKNITALKKFIANTEFGNIQNSKIPYDRKYGPYTTVLTQYMSAEILEILINAQVPFVTGLRLHTASAFRFSKEHIFPLISEDKHLTHQLCRTIGKDMKGQSAPKWGLKEPYYLKCRFDDIYAIICLPVPHEARVNLATNLFGYLHPRSVIARLVYRR